MAIRNINNNCGIATMAKCPRSLQAIYICCAVSHFCIKQTFLTKKKKPVYCIIS